MDNASLTTAAPQGAPARRSAGLDIVRTMAIFLVIGGHFFLNSPFNATPLQGPEMYLLAMFKTLILTNVPLFLMLTGYLNLNKRVSKGYYRGLLRVLVSYGVISLITILVSHFYLHETHTPLQWLLKVTDFSAIKYAWYIEMWIGLFLITPFLALCWNAIGSKRHHQVLLATMFVIVALPDCFNRYGVHLVPGYWANMQPVAFFFMGAYIRTYQPVFRARVVWPVIIALCTINPTLSMLMAPGQPIVHPIGGGQGIIGMPLCFLLFCALYHLNISELGGGSTLVRRISVLSLDMYLFNYILDLLIYPVAKTWTSSLGLLFLTAVPCVFTAAFALSWIKSLFPTPFRYK